MGDKNGGCPLPINSSMTQTKTHKRKKNHRYCLTIYFHQNHFNQICIWNLYISEKNKYKRDEFQHSPQHCIVGVGITLLDL